MKQLYLIAHIVTGEPSFDISIQIDCPMCTVDENPIYDKMLNPPGPHNIGNCSFCNSESYFWSIPTSGHRAYPYWFVLLDDIDDTYNLNLDGSGNTLYTYGPPEPPENWPDHYEYNPHLLETKETIQNAQGLLAAIGLDNLQPNVAARSAPIRRRV